MTRPFKNKIGRGKRLKFPDLSREEASKRLKKAKESLTMVSRQGK